jgi:hypothetical protein
MVNWPQVALDLPEGYSQCFGCGQDNPIGLKLKFEPDGKGVKAISPPMSDIKAGLAIYMVVLLGACWTK